MTLGTAFEDAMLVVLGVLSVGFVGFVFWTTRELWRTNVERLPQRQAQAARRATVAALGFAALVLVVSVVGSSAAALVLAGTPFALSLLLTFHRVMTGSRKRSPGDPGIGEGAPDSTGSSRSSRGND